MHRLHEMPEPAATTGRHKKTNKVFSKTPSSHWQEFHWLFNGHIWMYIKQAWEARRHPGVLVLFYEDLKDGPQTQVRR